MRKQVSRRDFLKSAAAGAVGLAAAGVLGACSRDAGSADATTTAEAVSTTPAETMADEETAGKADWLGVEPEIAEADVVATYDAEVIVVGSGTSGTFAACAAVEEGAKTILIEKLNQEFGGSGIRDTLGAIGSKQQIENNDNPDKFDVITELYRQSNGYGNQDLYKVWADHSGEAIDWYTERCAAANLSIRHEVDAHDHDVRYPIYDVGHSLQMSATQGAHGVTMNVLKEYASKLGLECHYDTAMVKLIKEDNKVTGLYAKTEAGYVRYNASKGVIVCTGGYGLNMEMLNALQPETVKMINISYAYPGCSGDGIKACLWAGAAMDETHSSMLFDRGGIKADAIGHGDGNGVLFWMGSQPFLKVDLNGNRFTNESGCYDYILHEAFKLPNQTYAMIWDANYIKDMQRFDSHGCSRMFPHVNGAESVWPIEMNEAAFMTPYRQEGIVVAADTIEELAEKLGLPKDNLAATVKRYNELYDMQKDEDYGKESYRLSELRTPPFEGAKLSGGYYLTTMDGIKIDTNMNALDKEGKVIEGLYCAGDCSGGYFGSSYPNLLAGAAAGRSVTFGRRAGKIAANREV